MSPAPIACVDPINTCSCLSEMPEDISGSRPNPLTQAVATPPVTHQHQRLKLGVTAASVAFGGCLLALALITVSHKCLAKETGERKGSVTIEANRIISRCQDNGFREWRAHGQALTIDRAGRILEPGSPVSWRNASEEELEAPSLKLSEETHGRGQLQTIDIDSDKRIAVGSEIGIPHANAQRIESTVRSGNRCLMQGWTGGRAVYSDLQSARGH